jgi:hypothetical protein
MIWWHNLRTAPAFSWSDREKTQKGYSNLKERKQRLSEDVEIIDVKRYMRKVLTY